MGPLSSAIDLLNKSDIIIACATPSASAMGISIIRVSGFFDGSFFSKILQKPGPIGPLYLKPRFATLVDIVDPTTSTILDNALALFFPTPNSFTGESVLEISVHGNPILVEKIINLFIAEYSLRHAAPGEFTLRAYRNKKLSLSQIEGLDLLLHATTQPLIQLSQHMLSGGLQQEFIDLKNVFDKHQAAIDILTDFSEDIGESEARKVLYNTWEEVKGLILKFHHRCAIPLSHLLKPSIVLYGPPNAGKSTLFNLFLGYKRSIVSDIAGTTRDYVKESLFIDNNEYFITDTAGIRDSVDSIEGEGIYFTFKNLNDAFAPILVYSVQNFNPDDFYSFYKLSKPKAVVFTHSDKNPDFVGVNTLTCPVYLTNLVKNDLNFAMLFKSIEDNLSSFFESKPIIVERQRIEITKIYSKIDGYNNLIMSDYGTDLGVVSSEFNSFRLYADNLIGYVNVDEILNYVFSNFCIGK